MALQLMGYAGAVATLGFVEQHWPQYRRTLAPRRLTPAGL